MVRIKVKGLNSDIFYHYTSIAAAENIIADNAIWLTHYKDLSDNLEIVRGMKLVQNIYASKFVNDAFLKNIFSKGNAYAPEDYYIFCLCPTADNDLLWNEYADNEEGVAIGFDAQSLLALINYNVTQKPCDITPVNYDIEGFKNRVETKAKNIKLPAFYVMNQDYIINSGNMTAIPHYKDFRAAHCNDLARGTLLKGASFKEEKEWRLVHCPEYGYDSSAFEYRSAHGKRRAILNCESLPLVELKYRKASQESRGRLLNALKESGYGHE